MFMAAGLTSDHSGILNYRFLITISMKKLFLIASAFALCLCASAQNFESVRERIESLFDIELPDPGPAHLTPTYSYRIPESDSYHAIVEDMLDLYGRRVQWAFEDRPSFDPEYAVKCIGIDGQPYLVAVTASRNIWYNKRESVKVISDTLKVSKELAGKLDALFRVAVETATFMPYRRLVLTDENGNKTLLTPQVFSIVNGEFYGSQICFDNYSLDNEAKIEQFKDSYRSLMKPFAEKSMVFTTSAICKSRLVIRKKSLYNEIA